MIGEVVLLANYIDSSCSESFRDTICDCVEFYLSNCKDFPGGDLDKFKLLAFLFELDDNFIKPEFDPRKNFNLSFTFNSSAPADDDKK